MELKSNAVVIRHKGRDYELSDIMDVLLSLSEDDLIRIRKRANHAKELRGG